MNMNTNTSSDREFEHFFCVCCGTIIKEYEPEFMKTRKNLIEVEPDNKMYNSGVVDILSAGYGSKHDTSMFYVAICDVCVTEAIEDGRLVYKGNYMFNDEPDYVNDKYMRGYDKKTRDSKINDILK